MPRVYDIAIDNEREATQQDVDILRDAVECGYLFRAINRSLDVQTGRGEFVNWKNYKTRLRTVKKFIDDLDVREQITS